MIVYRSSSPTAARRLVQRSRVRGRVVAAVRRETFEVVVREDVLERRELFRDGLDLAELLASSQTIATDSECASR